MKLYLVNAYGEQVDFYPFVVDENGLETFKSRMKQAHEEGKMTDLYVKFSEDNIRIEEYTIFWKEISIISDYPRVDSISYSAQGYDCNSLYIRNEGKSVY